MTLLNTAANLGGTWPASFVMWLVSLATRIDRGNHDPYMILQVVFSALGVLWLVWMTPKIRQLSALPDDAWRTHLAVGPSSMSQSSSTNDLETSLATVVDLDSSTIDISRWNNATKSGDKKE